MIADLAGEEALRFTSPTLAGCQIRLWSAERE